MSSVESVSYPELNAATSFLSSYLPLSTSQTTTESFSTSLQLLLRSRYANHWHPSDPERGSAYRALLRSGATLDQSILAAALQAGISHDDIRKALRSSEGRVWLGDKWTLWVDPGCVSLRVERGDSHASTRDGQLIEVYGKLPETMASQGVRLDTIARTSLNITATTPDLLPATLPGSTDSSSASSSSSTSSPPLAQDPNLLSPTKKPAGSRAIQILPPPARIGALRPTSPTPTPNSLRRMPSKPQLIHSPFVIPPTPTRPPPASVDDVFSPSPAAPPAAASRYDGLSLAAPSLGAPISLSRRSSSRGSSISSIGSRSSSGSISGGEEDAFSSTESLASSITSAGTHDVVSSPYSKMRSMGEVVMDGEFKYPPVPTRTHSASSTFAFPAHHRSHSSSSNHSNGSTTSTAFAFPPPSPSSASFLIPRSLPCSPSKPRRRGTRGGVANHSATGSISSPVKQTAANHEATSSISSISSVTKSSSSTVTEHSGGKVGVLGGGVLLGIAGVSKLGNARAEPIGEAKRRGRERRRGGNPHNVAGRANPAAVEVGA